MVFNPATDFLGLWRNIAGNVSKLEMPGLDYIIAGLARAGVINVTVSATAPVANQSTTAWLQAAVPSYTAEGVFYLWNAVTAAYANATPALFLDFLQACAGQSGISWWTTTDAAPSNTVGNNGDYALRTDGVGGIYGPKAAGAWPATPLPGTTNTISSAALDNTFGAMEGLILYRGAATWEALAIGAADTLLISSGVVPLWDGLSALLDTVFGAAEGSILYRDVAGWETLAPGLAGNVLQTNGAGAIPSWATRSTEFTSGTTMLFQQTAAPPGWTKLTVLSDCGLRVTSGAVGVTAGSAFSSVFAQTAVGNTTLSVTQIPPHTHVYNEAGPTTTTATAVGGGHAFLDTNTPVNTDAGTGGGAAHTHSVNLSLAYVDVIIAQKN